MGKYLKVVLPPSFQRGVHCDVVVTVNGKQSSKTLKVIKVGKSFINFMEIDRPNRKNIFRKIKMKEIYNLDVIDSASGEQVVRKVFLIPNFIPMKTESAWSNTGQSTPRPYQRIAYSNHSKGWSSNAPQYRNT
jgi:hypothetical protein